jgi:4'-phosphopantetheinyl transferase EntD
MEPTLDFQPAGAHRAGATDTLDALLTQHLSTLLPSRALGGVRAIQPGDENGLTCNERLSLGNRVVESMRASGAARSIARALSASVGYIDREFPRSLTGSPIWPGGLIGSLAHDEEFAAAVLCPASRLGGIGIDVEPIGHIDAAVARLILCPDELKSAISATLTPKAVFCIKEAVFKAVHPADGIFLEFHDVHLDFPSRTAQTS